MKLYKFFGKHHSTHAALIKRLHEDKEDAVLLYALKPTIFLGKNTDYKRYIENNSFGVSVYRLPIPGDSFYMDEDVIVFNILLKTDDPDVFHTKTLLNRVLNELGIDTVLNKRNDLLYKDKKVAGASQRFNSDKDYLWTGIALSFNVDYEKAEKVFKFTKHGGIRERSIGLWQAGVDIGKQEVIEAFERAVEEYFSTKLELQPEPEEVVIEQREDFLKGSTGR